MLRLGWLEAELQRKLTEPPLVVVAPNRTIAEAALQSVNDNCLAGKVSSIEVARVDVEIVVVENVEAFGAEFRLDTLGNRERLCQCDIEIPGSGSFKSIPSGHIRRVRTEVRNSELGVEDGFVGFRETQYLEVILADQRGRSRLVTRNGS